MANEETNTGKQPHPFTVVKGWGDWTFRLLLAAGVAGNLYLQREFVTRTEYKEDQKEVAVSLEKLSEAVSKLDRSLALIEAQQKRLDDHEIRLRHLERGK